MAEGRLGTTIGGYRLEQLLGTGGFGSVWRARQVETGEIVAVKLLTGTYSTGDVARQRADIELLAASASAASAHVVRVLGGGVEPTPYIVMEFIDGVNLASELRERGRLTVEETLNIGRAVADALAALDAAGIIHRDVKPANVMIDRAGVVKLTDFGIAKIVGYDSVTATGNMPLSMAYAAPEVWEGHSTHQSDLYALGVLLYQCLIGGPPFSGTPTEVFRQHLSTEPDFQALPAERPPSLVELLARCMAKDARRRPASADECRTLLDEAVVELVVARDADARAAPHEPAKLGPWRRRRPSVERAATWECVHESTGATAIVELHASDDIELGQRLHEAVNANAALVPFGAERLLGTNRLVLRPGEQWTSPPPGQFQFWVAREVLPTAAAPEHISHESFLRAVHSLASMIEAVRTAPVTLSLAAEMVSLLPDGRVLVRRPGLPPVLDGDPVAEAVTWLKTLPLDDAGVLLLDSVLDFEGLRALGASAGACPSDGPAQRDARFGVALAGEVHGQPETAVTEESELLAIRRMGYPLLAEEPALGPPPSTSRIRLSLVPLPRGRSGLVRYTLAVQNGVDAPADVTLSAADERGGLRFALPARVAVAPHATSTAMVDVRALRRRWRGGREAHIFTVAAHDQSGGAPSSVSAAFEDVPRTSLFYALAASGVGAVAALGVLAVVLAGGWNGHSNVSDVVEANRTASESTPAPVFAGEITGAEPPGNASISLPTGFEVVVRDDFSVPAKGALGPGASGSGGSSDYADEEFRIRIPATAGGSSGNSYNGTRIPTVHTDVYIGIDGRVVGDYVGRRFQLFCRASRNALASVQDAYVLVVDPANENAQLIRQRQGGSANMVLSALQHSPAIRPGTEVNHVELRCIGDEITGLANGVVVASARDGALTSGDAQILVVGPQGRASEFRFDNLVVARPAGAASASTPVTGLPAAGAGQPAVAAPTAPAARPTAAPTPNAPALSPTSGPLTLTYLDRLTAAELATRGWTAAAVGYRFRLAGADIANVAFSKGAGSECPPGCARTVGTIQFENSAYRGYGREIGDRQILVIGVSSTAAPGPFGFTVFLPDGRSVVGRFTHVLQ